MRANGDYSCKDSEVASQLSAEDRRRDRQHDRGADIHRLPGVQEFSSRPSCSINAATSVRPIPFSRLHITKGRTPRIFFVFASMIVGAKLLEATSILGSYLNRRDPASQAKKCAEDRFFSCIAPDIQVNTGQGNGVCRPKRGKPPGHIQG
jgi:hypothetical protein